MYLENWWFINHLNDWPGCLLYSGFVKLPERLDAWKWGRNCRVVGMRMGF